jgi:cytochrome c-type biogenesis protein
MGISATRWTKLFLLLVLGMGVALLVIAVEQFNQMGALRTFDQFVTTLGSEYRQWFQQQNTNNLPWLVVLSFAGGLVASISPCILSLLPVNLTYIGTREITSRRDALCKAGAFVLGVITILSLFGLFSSLAAIVLIRFRGYFHILVGIIILGMGLSLARIITLPLPSYKFVSIGGSAPARSLKTPFWLIGQLRMLLAGPYGVGLTFALVSSPCTSPVMFAVLAVGAATGSQWLSVLTMVSYAIGYTAIIFFASLFAGLAKQTHTLLAHSEMIVRCASLLLLLIGGFYLVDGSRWVIATWMM